MIDRSHELSLTRQAEILKVSRSGLYYEPHPVSSADLAIMRQLDELHLEALAEFRGRADFSDFR
jgi:putative transposase